MSPPLGVSVANTLDRRGESAFEFAREGVEAGLEDEALGVAVERFLEARGMVAGVEDDGGLLVDLADPLAQLHARAVGEAAVEQIEVEAAHARKLEPLLHRLHRLHLITLHAEQAGDEKARVFVVVYEKDAGRFAQVATPVTAIR